MKQKNLLKKLNNIGNLEVLNQGLDNYIATYVYYFKKLPSLQAIHCTLAIEQLLVKFNSNKDYTLLKTSYYDTRELKNIIFQSKTRDIIIAVFQYGEKESFIQFMYDVKDPPVEDINYVFKFAITRENKHYIYFMINDYNGLRLDSVEFKDKNINLNDNYNDDFYSFSDDMIKYLNEERSGVHILHGVPGSGKSSYIKYLINNINKKFIYCPTNLIPQLASPDFIKLITREGANCILIVEDAEDVLADNGANRSSAISNILNLSDGIIGDALNIQVITTFNIKSTNIDPAILRKGRLLSMYEFKELNIDKSKKLLESLGIKDKVLKPMTLADIYNYESVDYGKRENKIGL